MGEAQTLLEHASAARARAYAPYSRYRVGAAVLDNLGNIHTGCNVENASYPLGSCAEANAIAAMVAADGERIARLAIVGGREHPELCVPCGGCRQRIAEFADDQTLVILRDADERIVQCTLEDLLPMRFQLDPP